MDKDRIGVYLGITEHGNVETENEIHDLYNTHNLAQQIGGYIVTLTNHAERIWVYDNILANSTGYNLQNNIYILNYNR